MNSKIKYTLNVCSEHGQATLKDAEFNLNTPKKFISFVCFLIQFKFKLLNIEDTN